MKATCHCRAVELDVTLTEGLEKVRRCDCSFCVRRGAIAVSAPIDGVKIIEGSNNLTLYQWGTKTAKHYFCKTCGIYPFHRPRVAPDMVTVNVFCLEGVTRETLGEMEIGVFDGRTFSTVED